jgi:hypothetical protein
MLFAIIIRDGFNKHNFILINSYFFLIVLLIAILFVIINKPTSPLASEYFLPSILGNLLHSFYFLFIPFLTFLFFILIHFFKYQIIPFVVIIALAYWVYFIGSFKYLGSVEYTIASFIYFMFLPSIIWSLIYFRERSYSLFQKGILFNIIMVLFYSYLFTISSIGTYEYFSIPAVTYEPVYELSSSIVIIILFLIFVNLAIYIKGRSTLKALI